MNEVFHNHVSTCAYLSYVIYHNEIEQEWDGQPDLVARKSYLEQSNFLGEAHELDLVHWGLFSTPDTLYLCFRGSVTKADWVCNFNVGPSIDHDGTNYIFHGGFLSASHYAFDLIQHNVDNYLGSRNLVVTGHSLGGALAQLFAFLYEQQGPTYRVQHIITFAAPQACIATPAEHAALLERSINYACHADLVPMLPGILSRNDAGAIAANMAMDHMSLTYFIRDHIINIVNNAAPYLAKYHAFGHTVVIPNVSGADAMDLAPMDHQHYVKNNVNWRLQISMHRMLFYIGELQQLNLLNEVINDWFLRHNQEILDGGHEDMTLYYDSTQRSLCRVEYTLGYIVRMVTRPSFLLRSLVPVSLHRVVRRSLMYSAGSEYYFIDANISKEEVKELERLAYKQAGKNNIKTFLPGNYDWIGEISDMNAFLSSFRPVSLEERLFGDIDDKGRCLNAVNYEELGELTSDEELKESNAKDSPVKLLVDEIKRRREKKDANVMHTTTDLTSSSVHTKNIVLLCDGTWRTETSDHTSNIAKMDDILKATKAAGQITKYQTGLGTGGTRDKLLGGAFASGIDKKIIEMCRFLSENYKAGDKIFIFGFSRGAATARAISHMIYRIGILPRGSKRHAEAYECFASGTTNDVAAFRLENNVITDVKIQFLGVFDTVSALAFPTPTDNKKFFGNLTMDLHSNIVAARHALAVDEYRAVFPADVWTPVAGVDSEQRWFAGAHADVGGGYKNSGLSNVTLQWMLRNAVHYGLKINTDVYDVEAAVEFVRNKWNGYDPNWNGKLHDSLTYMYKALEFLMENSTTNYRTMMQQNDETIDESVSWRLQNHPDYTPRQLRDKQEDILMQRSRSNLECLKCTYPQRVAEPYVHAPVMRISGRIRKRKAEEEDEDEMEEYAVSAL